MISCKTIPQLSTILVLIVVFGTANLTYAQESSAQPQLGFYWINGGVGGGAGSATSGPAAGLDLSIQPPRPGFLLFSLRGIVTAEILGDDISDVAFLIGYSSKRPQSHGYFSIAIGVSRVAGSAIDATFGIPIELQLFYTPLSFVGIGLLGFADFNKEETFGGALLCLQFGKLR